MNANKLFNLATSTLLGYRRYIQAGLTLCAGFGLSAIACSIAYNWEYKFVFMPIFSPTSPGDTAALPPNFSARKLEKLKGFTIGVLLVDAEA